MINYGTYLSIYKTRINDDYVYKLCDKEYDERFYQYTFPLHSVLKVIVKETKRSCLYNDTDIWQHCGFYGCYVCKIKLNPELISSYIRSIYTLCYFSKGKLSCLRLDKVNMKETFKAIIMPIGNYPDIVKLLTQLSNIEGTYFENLPKELIDIILDYLLLLY